MHAKQTVVILAMLAVLIVVTSLLFISGVSGPFLLDDYTNLSGLALIDQFGWFKGTLQYLATNSSGALGRPVSLLTFLLDGQAWPTDPEPFKRTNIFLHVCSVLLVFTLGTMVAKHLLKNEGKSLACMAGFIAALLWAVHPLQVSTVLYVVQRMTILSALFGLASLVCFIKGRELVATPARSLKYLCAFKLLVVISVLSKENGALVFPLAWFLDALIFRGERGDVPAWYKQWRRLFLVAPTLMLIGYLAIQWPAAVASHEIREFDIWQRLLTQPRVLAFYLYNIFVPSTVAATLYFDSFPVSSGLTSPPTTIIAILSLVAVALVAIAMHRRWPVFVLATGWFLIGHSLEASFIPLELVFEHRNYLPSVGIAVAIGILSAKLYSVYCEYWQRALVLAVLAFVMLMTVPWTNMAVSNWSNESRLIYTWAFYDQASIRAQSDFAQLVAVQGQPIKAIEILESLREHHPSELSVRLRLASFYCEYTGGIPESVWQGFDRKVHDLFSAGVLGAAQRYLRTALDNNCPELDVDNVVDVFDLLLDVDKEKLRTQARASLHYILGNYLIHNNRVSLGFQHLDRASVLQPTVDIPLRQSVLMKNLGDIDRAKSYLDIARMRNRTRPINYPSRAREIELFAAELGSARQALGDR